MTFSSMTAVAGRCRAHLYDGVDTFPPAVALPTAVALLSCDGFL